MYQFPIRPIHLNFMFQKPFEPTLELMTPPNKAPNIQNIRLTSDFPLPNIFKNFINTSTNILFVFGKEKTV